MSWVVEQLRIVEHLRERAPMIPRCWTRWTYQGVLYRQRVRGVPWNGVRRGPRMRVQVWRAGEWRDDLVPTVAEQDARPLVDMGAK